MSIRLFMRDAVRNNSSIAPSIRSVADIPASAAHPAPDVETAPSNFGL